MATLNPDIRQADEVLFNGPGGWGFSDESLADKERREHYGREILERDMPVAMRAGPAADPMPEMLAKWNEFQKSKGRFPGSCDWSLLDEFCFNKKLNWLPQLIGSCVASNTFRGWVARAMYQIVLLGAAEEYLGRNEFADKNFSFYVPFSYGSARRRGNMRGGDGLYCDVMATTLLKDGVLPCDTPKLLEILKATSNADTNDFPEPQSTSFYRAWGDWKYLDDVKQYADYPLESCPFVTNVDELRTHLKAGSPCFFCSGIAIRKVGTHPDGFTIHARDPGNSWAHNMCFHGFFLASDGEEFFRFSNESWGVDVIYNVKTAEVADWFKNRRPSCAAIGMIRAPKSAPPTIG